MTDDGSSGVEDVDARRAPKDAASTERKREDPLPPLRSLLAGFGVAALFTGLICLFTGVNLSTRSDMAELTERTPIVGFLLVVFMTGVVVLAPMAAAGIGERGVRRALAVLSAVSGAGLVYALRPLWVFEYLRDERADHWAYGLGDLWLWIGMVAVTLGSVLYAVSPVGGWSLWRRPSFPAGAGAASLAVVLVMVMVRPIADEVGERTIEHTTAAPLDGAAPSVPESVSEVAWQWAPEDDLVPAGALAVERGVFVRLVDGGLLLDGETGEELWRHRRPGHTLRAGAGPEGTTVAMAFALPHAHHLEGGVGVEFLRLDAGTGEIVDERTLAPFFDTEAGEGVVEVYAGTGDDVDTDRPLSVVPAESGDVEDLPPVLAHMTDDLLLSVGGEERSVPFGSEEGYATAYDLETWETAWTLPEEEDCVDRGAGERDRTALVGDLVLTSRLCSIPRGEEDCEDEDGCPDRMAVAAWEVDTGRERWRHEWEAGEDVEKPPALRVAGESRGSIQAPAEDRGEAGEGDLFSHRDFDDRGDRVLVSRADTWYEGLFVLDATTGEVLEEERDVPFTPPEDGDRPDPFAEEPVGFDEDAYYARVGRPNDGTGVRLERVGFGSSGEPERLVDLTHESDGCLMTAGSAVCAYGLSRYRTSDTSPGGGHGPRVEVTDLAGGTDTISLWGVGEEGLDETGEPSFLPVPGALLLVPGGAFAPFGGGAKVAEEMVVGGREAPEPIRTPIVALR